MDSENNERREIFLQKVRTRGSDSRAVVLTKEAYDDLILKVKSMKNKTSTGYSNGHWLRKQYDVITVSNLVLQNDSCCTCREKRFGPHQK